MDYAKSKHLTAKDVNHADEKQFPHQVSIQSPTVRPSSYTWYGGSLIATNWILTAAHCTTQSLEQFNIRIGSTHRQTDGISMTAFESIAHPLFNSSNLNNDIALIKLPVPVELGDALVSIIHIAKRSHAEAAKQFVGHEAIVCGWGYYKEYWENNLLWNRVTIITNTQCAQVYGPATVTDNVLCSVAPKYVSAFQCLGDAGGPLIFVEMGVPFVVGVQSFSSVAGCDIGHPTGYVNVASFLDWIHLHTGIAIHE